MSNKEIKKHCKTVKKQFFKILEDDSQVAVFLLGNLYRYLKLANPDDVARIEGTLTDLKSKMSAQQINALWQAMDSFSPERWRVMDDETKHSVNALRRGMLRDLGFVSKIADQSMVLLAQSPLWYREAFIALMRKHLATKSLADPFHDPAFSFDLLTQGGPEQNYLYLSEYIRQCGDLPIESITQMAKQNPLIGSYILLDCGSSALYFEISKQLVEVEALRSGIAKSWKAYLENYPLTALQKACVSEALEKLKARYPEFKDVEMHARIKRHYTSKTFELSTFLTPETFDIASLSVMAPTALYLSPAVVAHGASIVTLGAAFAGGASLAKLGTLALAVCSTAPQVAIPLLLYVGIAWTAERWFNEQKDPHPKLKL